MTTPSEHTQYCSHCGNEIEENAGSCSVCNAPTHFHGKDWQKKTPRNFILYFIGLVIFCFLVMFIAPR
ncbi:MAG: hypothetical protein IME94_08125 [Proteobacteria bacterium]|nr:hypothetical protein [Pseudomonadota bacterium]